MNMHKDYNGLGLVRDSTQRYLFGLFLFVCFSPFSLFFLQLICLLGTAQASDDESETCVPLDLGLHLTAILCGSYSSCSHPYQRHID